MEYSHPQQLPTLTGPSLPSTSTLYNSILQYPWDQDPDFQSGLTAIMNSNNNNKTSPPGDGHDHDTNPKTPQTKNLNPDIDTDRNNDLVIQAQCFYFAR